MERYTVGSVRPRGQGRLQTYQLIKDNLQHLTAVPNPLCAPTGQRQTGGAIQAATISWLLLLLQAFLLPYPSISVHICLSVAEDAYSVRYMGSWCCWCSSSTCQSLHAPMSCFLTIQAWFTKSKAHSFSCLHQTFGHYDWIQTLNDMGRRHNSLLYQREVYEGIWAMLLNVKYFYSSFSKCVFQ